jgi:hypothetical protein
MALNILQAPADRAKLDSRFVPVQSQLTMPACRAGSESMQIKSDRLHCRLGWHGSKACSSDRR